MADPTQIEREAFLAHLVPRLASAEKTGMMSASGAIETSIAFVVKRCGPAPFFLADVSVLGGIPARETWVIDGDGNRHVLSAKTPTVCYRDVRWM